MFQGHNTPVAQKGLLFGIILPVVCTILSCHVLLRLLSLNLVLTLELGGYWPPKVIHPLNILKIPLHNTSILLASGAYHGLIERNQKHNTSPF
jgi:hypothetical protein